MGVAHKIPAYCGSLYSAFHEKCKEDAWVELNRLELQRRADVEDNPFIGCEEKNGDQILESLRVDAAQNMATVWSTDQNMFLEQIWLTILNHIYGPSLSSNLDRLMAQNKHWKRFMQVLDIMCPRRWGKTTTIAGAVADILKNLRKKEISIFSPGRRPSKKLLELIFSFVCKLGIESRVVRYNVETLWIVGDSPDDIRKVFSYPSKVKIIPLPLVLFFCVLCVCTPSFFTLPASTKSR